MLNSEIGPEMVYWFARNPAEAERIAKLGPYQTAAELRDIERNLSEQLKAPATKTITGARPPETALPGKIVSPEDPVMAAVASGDFRSYMKAANARELKR